MDEAAEEARASRQSQQQPFRMLWAAVKDLPLVGDRRSATATTVIAAAGSGGATEADTELDKGEESGPREGSQEDSGDSEAEDAPPKPSEKRREILTNRIAEWLCGCVEGYDIRLITPSVFPLLVRKCNRFRASVHVQYAFI